MTPSEIYNQLTGRHRRCADLVEQGMQNDEIAAAMGIKTRTVKSYMRRLFLKFGVRSGYKRAKIAVILAEIKGVEQSPTAIRFRPKQSAIIRCVARGYKNAEIAQIIGTTHQVVKYYLKTIYDMTGMGTRTELAVWYEAHGSRMV
jgi:DNA-binding CsgD family transcriptional regulator